MRKILSTLIAIIFVITPIICRAQNSVLMRFTLKNGNAIIGTSINSGDKITIQTLDGSTFVIDRDLISNSIAVNSNYSSNNNAAAERIYLYNGSIINGEVISNGKIVKIKDAEGNEWEFNKDEINKVVKNTARNHSLEKGLSDKTDLSNQGGNLKRRYVNLLFPSMEMKQDNFPTLKSNYGIALNIGKTFYIHKKPVANLLYFGIDATWVDINYTNYSIEHITYLETKKYAYHQAEIAIQVGPSINLNPVGKLNLHGYFRYAPSFSALYMNDSFYGNYATFFVGGASISYGVIGLGVESRFGDCNYRILGTSNNDEGYSNLKTKFSGLRAYLTFRF